MTNDTDKNAHAESDNLDALFAELEESGDLRVVELDEDTEFQTVSLDGLFAMLKAHVLEGLPPHVRQQIEANEAPTRT